jgi:glutathione synthase/RimK-type ligase-like ATP-grasp enzyme
MTERIGIICGWEESFPQALIAKIDQAPGFKAELAKLGGISEAHTSPFRVLVDRISHEVPYYRFFLKAASLSGSYVINDPFWWSADDRFFGTTLAAKVGVRVPRTVMLPQHSYLPSVDPKRSLRNLEYPLDWEDIVAYIGFPAILKPAVGGGMKHVAKVHNINELWAAYNASGTLVMILQQYIDFQEFVRCICIGRELMLPIKYDPRPSSGRSGRGEYIETSDHFLPGEVEQKILDNAWALNHALGYDVNSLDFAIKDDIPYAIDFTNPVPEIDVHSLRPRYFNILVDEMARFVLECARDGRKNHGGYPFRRFLDQPAGRPPHMTWPAATGGR